MEARLSTILLAVLLVLSAIGHGLLYVALGLLPPLEELLAEDAVEVQVVEVEPEPEPEELEEVEEPEPEPVEPEPQIVRRVVVDEAPPPEPEPPPPQEETIEEFQGVTLTNEGEGESWATNVGNGAEIVAPSGRPNAVVTGRNRTGTPTGTPGGTGENFVAASDLSREPRIPDIGHLAELLEHNYPQQARQLQIEGFAVVRVQVFADGRINPGAAVRESGFEGFAEACRRALRAGGRWEPAVDRQGRQVPTVTTFRCTFTVDDF